MAVDCREESGGRGDGGERASKEESGIGPSMEHANLPWLEIFLP
jgi:hypothetical protein